MSQIQFKWNAFIKELGNLTFFWIFSICFFFLFRVVFICLNLSAIAKSVGWSDYLNVFFMGFRFDATISAYFIALPFLSLLVLSFFDKVAWASKIRVLFQRLFVVLSAIVCIVTINYFNEYNDQFNHFLFLGLYDDQKAVTKTILEDFNPLLNLAILIVVITVSWIIFKYFRNKCNIANFLGKGNKTAYKVTIVVLSLLLFVGSIRGGLGKNPAMRKWAYVSSDEFLNKVVINPFRSLKYAISDFKELNKPKGSNPYGKFIGEKSSLLEGIRKKDVSENTVKPKQVFLVVMESYDSWPLLDKYKNFGVSTKLKNIQERGIHFPNFLPASGSTLNSFGAIITGVPYVGVNINQIGATGNSFKSSIFKQFKKLGYETNFFYGGFLSWQNVGNLTKNQGVDHLYSAPNAGGKTESGVWGIEDEKLFNLVYNSVDKNTNSINVILTTSYHPPYKIDVFAKGFPYRNKEELPKDAQKYYKEGMSFKALGHLWYSDKAIGDFVSKAENKYPDALFCFTGDHFGRRFVNKQPNLYEKSAVPLILYGKGIEPGVNKTPGSHIDISPTLIEMVAPKDYEYYSFGKPLLNEIENGVGIGHGKVISDCEIEKYTNASNHKSFNFIVNKSNLIEESKYKKEHDSLLSLAWEFTIKKDEFNNH